MSGRYLIPLFWLTLKTQYLGIKAYLISREQYPVLAFVAVFLVTASLILVSSLAINQHAISRDLNCLAMNIYHEARGEPSSGQYAVARVTMNRVASTRYPNEICDVVHQKRWDRIRKRYVGAFSWTELNHTAAIKEKAWKKAWRIAEDVYHNHQTTDINGALFYHAKYIKPSWARKKQPVARIGKHIFYQ